MSQARQILLFGEVGHQGLPGRRRYGQTAKNGCLLVATAMAPQKRAPDARVANSH
jgi:hypothetical protein